MKKLFRYLEFSNIGFFELLFALYPILGGYKYSAILDLSTLVPILLIILSYKKPVVTRIDFKYLNYFIAFIIIHEIVLSFILISKGETVSTLYNNLIVDCILFWAIIRSVKVLRFDKLKGALYLVGLLSSIGIVYHFLLIRSGQSISPIPFPLLPAPPATSRLYSLGLRPVSFFWEPAAYITFILMPLFVSMIDKKYTLTIMFAISNFLSTSTNGMVFTILMIALYVATQNISVKQRIYSFLGGVGLVVFLLTSSLFSAGRDKVSDTDIETQARLVNGPVFVQYMNQSDLFMGIPNQVPYDYIIEGNVNSVDLLMDPDSFYVPAIWYSFIKFGIVGLVLYLLLIIGPCKRNRILIPFCLTIFLSTFVQSIFLNSNFYTEVVFVLCLMYYYKNPLYEKDKSVYNNYPLCK